MLGLMLWKGVCVTGVLCLICYISGTIPTAIGLLTNTVKFGMHVNQLTGMGMLVILYAFIWLETMSR